MAVLTPLVLLAGLVAQPTLGPAFDMAARVWSLDAGDGCYWFGPEYVICPGEGMGQPEPNLNDVKKGPENKGPPIDML